ncbi:MAG: hypothetical protein PHX62_08915 [Bacilli bacterium]|nr:hypothetical protein [Bacilli bacterium]
MNKIVYMLGAGASYGTREKNTDGSDVMGKVIRGVPIVSEISKSIDNLIIKIDKNSLENENNTSADEQQKNELKQLLLWLKYVCDKNPTIDTYAKCLYISKKTTEYAKLKLALSIFLILSQNPHKRDLRYDGFIASLIKEDMTFPNDISILSWNYDCQLEFAFADYLKASDRYLHNIWNKLNLSNKTIPYKNNNTGFSVIKLNGTASFFDNNDTIIDLYFALRMQGILSRLSVLLSGKIDSLKSTLSFAWEKDSEYLLSIKNKIKDAQILVVIGYSFPYFNREVDRELIQSMTSLEKIYIQDPRAEDVKESFEATLPLVSNSKLNYVLRKNLSQFVIPNELV